MVSTLMETIQKLHEIPNIIVLDIHFSLGIFGLYIFIVWVLSWLISYLTILNIMEKIKLQINASYFIFFTLHLINIHNRLSGYPWKNGVTTLCSILHPKFPHSWKYMVIFLNSSITQERER
jgi:hypothetical protein